MLFTFSNAEERGILLTISCLAHGRGFLCIEWLIHARRFLAAKHSRLGKLAVLGTPKAAKCARRRMARSARSAKGRQEAAPPLMGFRGGL